MKTKSYYFECDSTKHRWFYKGFVVHLKDEQYRTDSEKFNQINLGAHNSLAFFSLEKYHLDSASDLFDKLLEVLIWFYC